MTDAPNVSVLQMATIEGNQLMRQGLLALVAIVIAIAVAVLAVKLLNKGTETVRNPQPMRPAVVTPCPPAHAMIARICVPRG